MTKSELIDLLKEKTGHAHAKCETAVSAVFDSIAEALMRGERVEIRGFGVFEVRHYGEYKGRNPRTGLVIPIEPKRQAFFKVGKHLMLRIRNSAKTK